MKFLAQFLVSCLVLVLVGFAQRAHAQVTCASLVAWKGQVEILRRKEGDREVRNAFRAHRDVEPLNCDDVLVFGADGSGKILIDEAKVVAAPETRIELASLSKKVGETKSSQPKVDLVSLAYGRLRSLVEKKSEPKTNAQVNPLKTKVSQGVQGGTDKQSAVQSKIRFRVQTPTAVAGVRGTDFFTSFDPRNSKFVQATIEGEVLVEDRKTKQTVSVLPQQQVVINEPHDGKEKPPLVAVVISPRVKAEMQYVSAIVKADKEFVSPQAEQVLGKPEAWRPSLEELKETPPDSSDFKNQF